MSDADSEITFDSLTHPDRSTLGILVVLHWFESLAQIIALPVASYGLGLDPPEKHLWFIVLLFIGWNVYSSLLLRRANLHNIEGHVCVQLLVEVCVLASLLYYTGGATNPFVSLFLVPIALGAIMLPVFYAVSVAMLAIFSYTLLLFVYEPLANHSMHHMVSNDEFGLHIIGMWVNFLLSAVVSLVALSYLASLARSRAERIASLRERILQDSRVSALGGMAAATAHSLSTPLSTVAVILDELAHQQGTTSPMIATAREQLDVSRERLSAMLDRAHVERMSQARLQSVQELLDKVVSEWKLIYPTMRVAVEHTSTAKVLVDGVVTYCLTNILDNAAEANQERSRHEILVGTSETETTVWIEIEDQGGGPLPDERPASSKAKGAGVGLTITSANLQRYGGGLSFRMGEQGCIARITLPLVVDEA